MNDEIQNHDLKPGLRPLEPDERDFNFGNVTQPVNLAEIAGLDFDVFIPTKVKNQTGSPSGEDLCTAYGGSQIAQAHESVELNPEWLFAKVKKLDGDFMSWGSNVRTLFSALCDYGALEEEDARSYMSGSNALILNLRDWKNWAPELDERAVKHRQKSYFFIKKGSYFDLFDSIRANLYRYREQKHVIGTGALWRPQWTIRKFITDTEGEGIGHFFVITGVKYFDGVPYLKILQLCRHGGRGGWFSLHVSGGCKQGA